MQATESLLQEYGSTYRETAAARRCRKRLRRRARGGDRLAAKALKLYVPRLTIKQLRPWLASWMDLVKRTALKELYRG